MALMYPAELVWRQATPALGYSLAAEKLRIFRPAPSLAQAVEYLSSGVPKKASAS